VKDHKQPPDLRLVSSTGELIRPKRKPKSKPRSSSNPNVSGLKCPSYVKDKRARQLWNRSIRLASWLTRFDEAASVMLVYLLLEYVDNPRMSASKLRTLRATCNDLALSPRSMKALLEASEDYGLRLCPTLTFVASVWASPAVRRLRLNSKAPVDGCNAQIRTRTEQRDPMARPNQTARRRWPRFTFGGEHLLRQNDGGMPTDPRIRCQTRRV
jgi:hypothetical protein